MFSMWIKCIQFRFPVHTINKSDVRDGDANKLPFSLIILFKQIIRYLERARDLTHFVFGVQINVPRSNQMLLLFSVQ